MGTSKGTRALVLAAALAAVALVARQALADTEERAVAPFDRITFALPGRLYLERADTHAVTVTASADDLENVETTVADGQLTIGWESGFAGLWNRGPSDDVEVRVALPVLAGLKVTGSGDVEAGGWSAETLSLEVNGSGGMRFTRLETSELRLEVAGSGDADIAGLEAGLLQVEVMGSGNVELAGRATNLRIEVMGSGDVDAQQLQGRDVEVEVMGSGNVRVWATDRLDAEILGSGDVRYRGEPELERDELGSGRVHPL